MKSIVASLAVLALGWLSVDAARGSEGSRTVIHVDAHQGGVTIETEQVVTPLYEATFRLATKELWGWKPTPLISDVGAPVSQAELPQLATGRCIRFWTEEYI